MCKKNWFIIMGVVLVVAVLVSCKSKGGEGSPDSTYRNTDPTAGPLLSGTVAKGPIQGATITVYALNDAGDLGAVLTTATTGADGKYSVDLNSYTGNVLAVADGGTYTDEATGAPVTNAATLRAAFASAPTMVVSVTPLTEIAVQRAGTLTLANIESANTLVSNMIGGIDIITTQPANVLVASSSTTAEKDYGLALAAFSQMVSSGTATSVSSAMSQIATDLADNKLDATGGDIATALSTFIASANNQTGLTATTAAVLQSIIDATTTPISTTSTFAKQLSLYDDFSSPTPDTTKWIQGPNDTSGTLLIVNGQMQIVSSVANSISAFARGRFTSPDTIQAMSADVAVTNYQSTGGSHFARISGAFYNDGTPGSAVGSQVGDIGATIVMTDNAISYGVYRCLDSTCQTWTYLTSNGVNNHILLANSALGQTHTLFMQWDGSVFIFQVDNNAPVKYDPKPQAPVVSSTPNFPNKWIGIRHLETDGQSGSVTATFDNVRAGASLPIAAPAPATTVWKAKWPGSVLGATAGQSTNITVVNAQTDASLSGKVGFEDTMGVSAAQDFTGTISGNNVTFQVPEIEPGCPSRVRSATGTISGDTMNLSWSAPASGTCPAISNASMVATRTIPVIYTASGTYSYDSSSATATTTFLNSDFPNQRGPGAGGPPEAFPGITVTATSMNLLGPLWTRSSGNANDIKGSWSFTESSGNEYHFILNADNTFTLLGKIATGGYTGNAEGWSTHNGGTISVNPGYNDPNHAATAVTFTGPGASTPRSLVYNPRGDWVAFLPPATNLVYTSATLPALPLTYTLTATFPSGIKTEIATIECFILDLVSNVTVTNNASGMPVFSWTKLGYPYMNMGYKVILRDHVTGNVVWNSEDFYPTQTDISSLTYAGPALSTGKIYDYSITVISTGSGDCEATTTGGNFTY